jgi:hypothetical protein
MENKYRISVYFRGSKNQILPYKWLFWWVFNFRFLREGVKCAKNEVPELLFPKFCGINKCISFQDIFAKFCSRENKHLYGICFPFDKKIKYSRGISPHQKNWTVGPHLFMPQNFGNNNSGTSFFAHLTPSRRKRKLNTHQNNHLYGKIGFFFLDFNTDFRHC